MRTLTLQLPDDLEMSDRDVAMLLASRLYEQGRLSLGQAAEVAGLSKRTFAELLGSYAVSILITRHPTWPAMWRMPDAIAVVMFTL